MKLKQISLFLENKPGALNEPCKILAEHNISISTLTLADTKQFGILRLLIQNWEAARDILKSAGLLVKVTEVVAIEIDHTPGSLAKVLETFTKHGINVEYLYAFPAGVDGKAVIIFRFDDPDYALEKLQSEHGLVIVDETTLFAQ